MAEKSFEPLIRGAPVKDTVTVFVGETLKKAKAFHGWESVSITKQLKALCDEYKITLFDKFTGLHQTWPFKPGTKIHIHLGKESIFTGRVEAVAAQYTNDKREFTISGRSLAGDLIDCYHEGPFEYNDKFIEEIAKDLCAPFGIRVSSTLPLKTISSKKISIKPGATIAECLEAASRANAAFWISTVEGGIQLVRAGTQKAFSSLEQNVNLLSCSALYDDSKRHDRYVVKSQVAGGDDFFAGAAAQSEGIAFDKGVGRYRPFVLVAETSETSAGALLRAQWEAAHRLASAVDISASVQGWRQANGALWGINQLVRIKSSFLGINQTMLIGEITYEHSNNGGTTATMKLTDKDAFIPEPSKKAKTADDPFSMLGDGEEGDGDGEGGDSF